MRDYERLAPDHVEGPAGPDYRDTDRAVAWARDNEIKYGALALAFWGTVALVLAAVCC